MFYRSYLEVEFHGVSSRTYVKIRPEVTLQNSYILTTIARIYVIINFQLFVNPASTVMLEFVKVYFVYICRMTRQNNKMHGRATEITIYVKCSWSKLKGNWSYFVVVLNVLNTLLFLQHLVLWLAIIYGVLYKKLFTN